MYSKQTQTIILALLIIDLYMEVV